MKIQQQDIATTKNMNVDVPFLTDMSKLISLMKENGHYTWFEKSFPIETGQISGHLRISQENEQIESWEGKLFSANQVILNHAMRVNYRAFTLIFFQSLTPVKLRMNHPCFHEVTVDAEGKEGVVFLNSLTNLSILIPQDTLIQFKVVSIKNLSYQHHWVRQSSYRKVVENRMPFFYYWPQRIAFHEKAMLTHVEVFLPNSYASSIQMLDELFLLAGNSLTMNSFTNNLWEAYYLFRAEVLLRNTRSLTPSALDSVIDQSKLPALLFYIRFKQLFGVGIEQYHDFSRKEQMKSLIHDLKLPLEEVESLF